MNSKATATARIVLGLVFLVNGLNGFLHFMPQPSLGGAAAQFMTGLTASGYFFPLLSATQAIVGAALLSSRFVPLALTVLAPIIVNIVAVHVFLEPAGLPLAVLVLGLELFLAWSYRAAFRPLLRARSTREVRPTATTRTGLAA